MTSAHLDVVITVDALGHRHGAELLDGTPLDAATVARLVCDADVHRVVMDKSSTVLDYGRRARVVPNGLRQALNVRDRHCRFPGCDRSPAFCEGHHIIDWPSGGHTKPDNVVLLCARHHHLLHLDGWTHALLPDNTLEVATPTGHKLHSRPPPPPDTGRLKRRSNGDRSSVDRRD